jgi:uncharacterized protein YbbK (DUF523 family)
MRRVAKSEVISQKSKVRSPESRRARPVVVVSKCLLGERCRYDGKTIFAPAVLSLRNAVEFVPVCPETGVGLDVPRLPIRLVETRRGIRLIQTLTGKDMTRKMRSFSRTFLAEHKADGFILKARSPSCAVSDALVYDESGQETGLELQGVFADEALNRSLSVLMEDEESLRDPGRMARFIKRLFEPGPEPKKRRSR